MVRKYYGNVNITFKPLLITGELPPLSDGVAVGQWREARQATESLRADAEKMSAECEERQQRLADFNSAHQLVKAGFRLKPKDFGLPDHATSLGTQESAARRGLDETSAAMSAGLAALDPFIAALRQRVTLALRFDPANRTPSNPEAANVASDLVVLLAAVGAQMARAHEIGSKLRAFALLLQNRSNPPDSAEDEVISQQAVELDSLIGATEEQLKPFAYPFPHARGRLTVAEYARSERPGNNDWHRVYLDSAAFVDRLFALHYRLVGRILAHAEAAETRLEKQ